MKELKFELDLSDVVLVGNHADKSQVELVIDIIKTVIRGWAQSNKLLGEEERFTWYKILDQFKEILDKTREERNAIRSIQFEDAHAQLVKRAFKEGRFMPDDGGLFRQIDIAVRDAKL